MKRLIFLSSMFVIMLGAIACEDSENLPAPYYSFEGKWIWSPTSSSSDSNTMYLFEDGIRYTYYCTSEISDDCQSLFESFQANDGNHIPGTNPYTYENDTLRVDLHFGNELVAPLIFECDGGKVYLDGPNPHYLYRLNSDCE